MAPIRLVLIVLGLICFVLSALGIPSRVNLQSAGLALWIATLLF